MPVLHCYQVAAMAECSGKEFAIRHDQSVKDGSTMMFMAERAEFWPSAMVCHPQSISQIHSPCNEYIDHNFIFNT